MGTASPQLSHVLLFNEFEAVSEYLVFLGAFPHLFLLALDPWYEFFLVIFQS